MNQAALQPMPPTVARASRRPGVLMIGPMSPAVGGMVTVAEQLISSSLRHSFNLRRLPANAAAHGTLSLPRSVLRHARRMGRLAALLLSGRVDLVHIHTCSGFTFFRNLLDAWLSRACGAGVVLHIHGARFDEFCARCGPYRRWLIRRGLTAADAVVVLSAQWQEVLQPYAPAARWTVVPNGVPLPDEDARIDTPEQSHPCHFLFLGSIGRRKGLDVLLDAAARLRDGNTDFRLTIAGPEELPGDERAMRRRIEQLDIGRFVRYTGAVGPTRRDELLSGCACLVLPSRAEGLPLTLLEAGARGRAVIATDVGAVAEVIASARCGVLVPPDDVPGLTAAMATLAGDPQHRRQMGKTLNERVARHYSLAHQCTRLHDLYQRVLVRARSADDAFANVAGIVGDISDR